MGNVPTKQEKTNYLIRTAAYSSIGERATNEDKHVTELALGVGRKYKSLMKHKEVSYSRQTSPALFGVFDGHGGMACSRFVSENICGYVEDVWL